MRGMWRTPCEDDSRHWRVAKVSSKSPAAMRVLDPLSALGRNQPCPHLDLRLLASRTVRQYISVV
jgi:hypothetical protein